MPDPQQATVDPSQIAGLPAGAILKPLPVRAPLIGKTATAPSPAAQSSSTQPILPTSAGTDPAQIKGLPPGAILKPIAGATPAPKAGDLAPASAKLGDVIGQPSNGTRLVVGSDRKLVQAPDDFWAHAEDFANDIPRGVVKSGLKTISTIGHFLPRVLGKPGAGFQAGLNTLDANPNETTLSTPGEKVGAGLEQAGEMELTGGPFKAGLTGLARYIPGASRLLPVVGPLTKGGERLASGLRIGTAAANAAGSAVLHDQPVGTSALIGGGATAAGEALPLVVNPLKRAALNQYTRALAPTTKANKAIAERIAPEMIARGLSGSLEGLEDAAGQQADTLREPLNQAYQDLEQQTAPVAPKIKGLLNAAPTDIPLAQPEAGEMPGALQRAQRPEIPESAFSPEARIARGDSGLSPVRLTDAPGPDAPYRYYSTSGEGEVPAAPQSEAGVLRTRDPEIANQFTKPQGTYPTPKGGVPNAGTQIISDLDKLKSGYVVDGQVANQQAYKAVEGVQDVVRQYGRDISPTSLRQLKQIFDEPVAAAGGYTGNDLATHYTLNAQEAAANSIRKILHQASPDIAALDKEVSFWLNVQRVTGASALRRTGQEGGLLKTLMPFGAAAGAATGFAATHGPAGTIEGATVAALSNMAAQAIRTPAWRTTSAIFKDRLAGALARGESAQVAALLGRFGVAAQASSTNSPSQPPSNQSSPSQ